MKFVTFSLDSALKPGALLDDAIADLSGMGRSLLEIIAGCPDWARLREAVAQAPRLPISSIRLAAPIPIPLRNILCVGKNYAAHAREFQGSGFDASSSGQEIPAVPIMFTKATTTVIGPEVAIPASSDPTNSVDYEGELAVVIGRGGRGIARQLALGHVFGYTIINDVTCRHLQQLHKQWFLGKSLDGFCPMGPVVVSADEIPDPTSLRLQTRVNGQLRQDAPLADLIFDIPALIETISAGMSLLPGDIIATGTPDGVGIGFSPPKFLQAGDRVAVTIQPIGTLGNPVA